MIDEDATAASVALVSFVRAFARLILEELRQQQEEHSIPQGEDTPRSHKSRRLLTAKEAADLLQVAPNTVYEISHWKGPDGLRSVRIGRTVRFRMVDIEAYLDRQARGGPPASI